MQRQILATARRDLGDAQLIPQMSGSVEANFKGINPQHALLRDDRLNVPCDLPLDNIIPDVLIVTMPLSRLPEMAKVAIAMFSPELEGPQKEPPPRRVIFAKLMNHMACECLPEDLPRMLREMSTHEAARNEVAGVSHQVATAMERTAELLRTHLRVPALFVSPPGMLYWGGMFQQYVYILTEV